MHAYVSAALDGWTVDGLVGGLELLDDAWREPSQSIWTGKKEHHSQLAAQVPDSLLRPRCVSTDGRTDGRGISAAECEDA